MTATLAELLRYAREQQGLSRLELAIRLGVSETAVRYWESGRNKPRPLMLERIESVLYVTDDYFKEAE